jgi:hypothetical protein
MKLRLHSPSPFGWRLVCVSEFCGWVSQVTKMKASAEAETGWNGEVSTSTPAVSCPTCSWTSLNDPPRRFPGDQRTDFTPFRSPVSHITTNLAKIVSGTTRTRLSFVIPVTNLGLITLGEVSRLRHVQ